jgi:hypothetical protein
MWTAFWRTTFIVFFAFGVLSLITGLRLAMTGHSLDWYFRDRYLAISPANLFVITGVFAIATYAVWKLRMAH